MTEETKSLSNGNMRKLVVEVCNARNLMPKDGQGTASAYVIVDYDGQRRRTSTVPRDLNPRWDELHHFHVINPSTMPSQTLELNVYNDTMKPGKRSNFLGKVKIAGSSFLPAGSQTSVYYPLEKRSVFSQIKGDIGIKIWYEDIPPAPAPEEEADLEKNKISEEQDNQEEKKGASQDQDQDQDHGKKDKSSDDEKTKKTEDPPATPALPPPPAQPATAPDQTTPPIAQQKEIINGSHTSSTTSHQLTKSGGDLEMRSLAARSGHAAFDLVDRMPFLFVRLVKAKTANPYCSAVYAKLVIGTHSVKTASSPPAGGKDWDRVFAFDKEGLNSTSLEVSVWTETIKTKTVTKEVKKEEKESEESKKAVVEEEDNKDQKEKETSSSVAVETVTVTETETEVSCLGTVSFDLQEVPKRVPPDSPLAPQWHTLEEASSKNSSSDHQQADVMLAVWLGTQADEAFQEAWQSDSGGSIPETRSKVYLSPNLWYLRLTVIQTQDLQLGLVASPNRNNNNNKQARPPELYVKAQLGSQVFKTCRTTSPGPTTSSSSSSSPPTWNEDLIFVAAEPFEPFLTITVEDVTSGRPVGHARVNVATIEKRTDDRTEAKSRWFNLVAGGDQQQQPSPSPYAGRIHVRMSLEGGYHVLDEAAHVTSDVRPSAKQLAKPAMGLLEVGIRGANNLLPVKTRDGTRGTTDAYVVVKYGPKWVRTRTILDRFNPRWNEQFTWDVYDPCTVVTIGVFDNGRSAGKPGGRDMRIGKVRIRLSTLDANRAYFTTHALTVLLPGGAKRMGEIDIAIRFSCSSWISLMQAYSSPMLPRMHYVCPMTRAQQDILRHTAMRIVTARLSRSEPALGQEVVQFMLDTDAHVWSMRKSKVNWFRLAGGLSKVASLARWVDGIKNWSHPPTTVLVHMVLVAVVLCPHLILPSVFMYAFLILALRVRYRRKMIPLTIGMDLRLSHVDAVGPDELDEEFDGFPTSGRPAEVITARYDRLRALAGRAQSFLGDMAAQWERVEALYNWKDPRATGIFVVLCLVASLVFYVVPFRAFVLGFGFYYLRHPKFRDEMPSVPANFFRRLPSLSDQLL